jgi:competence protein ComEC
MKMKLYVLFGLLILNFFLWNASLRGFGGNELYVYFLDIGQGDAIFIESPVGNQILIDAGPNKKVLEELGSIMPYHDRSIDLIIGTHPDMDHIGGIPDVLDAYNVLAVIDPGISSDTNTYKAYVESVDKEGATYIRARRGQVIDLGGGAYIKVLFPDRDVSHVEPNAGSVVTQLVYGDTEVMLTGDLTSAIEKYLVSIDEEILESDILKAGHHGSRTSTSPEFLSSVNPDIVVVSAGKDNKYGHPHQDVIDLLEKSNKEVIRTYEYGTVGFVSDGVQVRLKK